MYKGKRILAVVLARRGSRRLKDKMLLPLGGVTVLEYVLNRTHHSKTIDRVVLAGSDSSADDIIAETGREFGIRIFRGPENDVVARMIGAVESSDEPPDFIVRLNADNPFWMPRVVDEGISRLVDHTADIVTPFEFNTYPFGFGMVCMTRQCLEKIDTNATAPAYREHVETYCFEHPDKFRIVYQEAPPELIAPELSVTLDYPEDYRRLQAFASALNDVPIERQPEALLGTAAERDHMKAPIAPGWIIPKEKGKGRPRPGFESEHEYRFPREIVVMPGSDTAAVERMRRVCNEKSSIVDYTPEKSAAPEKTLFKCLYLQNDRFYALPGDSEAVGSVSDSSIEEVWQSRAMKIKRVRALNARSMGVKV